MRPEAYPVMVTQAPPAQRGILQQDSLQRTLAELCRPGSGLGTLQALKPTT
jgi:hypothetical protein